MAYSVNHHPLPTHGFWGEITSTLHWCEEKYKWSRYVAEPVNTFTNVGFIYLAVYGARKCIEQSLPLRFFWTNMGIAMVGVGSFLFHGTLKYEAQLMDELPMLWVSTLLLWCVCETGPAYAKPSFLQRVVLPLGLFAMVSGVTIAYIISRNPVFHQVCYGLIQACSLFRVIALLTSSSSPFARTEVGVAQRSVVRRLYAGGAASFLAGFILWNIDNGFCHVLRALRHRVGAPWSAFLELHGAWHILTGGGCFFMLVACELLCLSLKESPANFAVRWRTGFTSSDGATPDKAVDARGGSLCLPYVVRVKAYDPKLARLLDEAEAAKREARRTNGAAEKSR